MSNVKTIGYYVDNHEQGLFPPNKYFMEPLIYYLPSDIHHEEPLLSDGWLKELKKYFNDLLFTYYYDRAIINDNRFNSSNEVNNYNNLRHVIAHILDSRQYEFENLYNSTVLEFNPLWNVDGTETITRQLKQTGTDTHAQTGTDTTTDSGSDVTTDQQTTYDTSFLDTNKSTLTHGKSAQTTYGGTNTETKNLTDNETTTIVRSGNIGVTTSTKLLSEYRDYSKFDLWKYITREVVNQISYGIY